ncbi:hypothetical protein ACEPAI_5585 [Sanghuangporus weigelae]
MRTSFRMIKDVRDSLESFLDNVQQTIKEMETMVVPPSIHYGLMSLPEEIFMHIVDMACAETENNFGRDEMDTLIKRLSLVSWKFQHAVGNTISFWTRIDNRYCLGRGFGNRIARTRNAPLVMHIDLQAAGRYRVRIVTQISLLQGRCQRLDARLPPDAVAGFPLLQFTSLDSVKLFFPYHDESNRWFYDKCMFPNIRSLESISAIPSSHPRANLTTVELKAGGSYAVDVHWYERLMGFLNCAPSIRSLSVELDICAATESGELISVNMPCVTSISIYHRNNFKQGMLQRLHRILASLEMPNVLDCDFSLYLTNNRELETALDSMREKIPEVTTLTIVAPFNLEAVYLKELVKPFARIRKLAIDAPQVTDALQGLDSDLELNQLRSVVLGRLFLRRSWAQHGEFHSLATHADELKITFESTVWKFD